MKRFATILILALMPSLIWGQAQITTRKVKFNDFTEKITKVVLTGNIFYDSALKEEISNRWRLSPYEFCTGEEFEKIKTDDNYYFLLTTKGQFKKESAPGISFLSLVKGGENAAKSIRSMLEVVSIPLCPAENPSGREFLFLPAFIEIIQIHTGLSMQYDFNAYLGLSRSTRYMSANVRSGHQLLISEKDLSPSIRPEFKEKYEGRYSVVKEEKIDKAMMTAAPGTLVSYTVTPNQPGKGSFCYKMIINTEDKTMFYFKRHKVSRFAQAGFLENDLRRVIELLDEAK